MSIETLLEPAPTALALAAMGGPDECLIDFESFSECDLKECGAEVYAQHPSTEILCMSWRFADMAQAEVWVPGRSPFPQRVIDHIANGGTIKAHNVGFEKAIWRHICVPKMGLPWPKRWKDTMAACAMRGLPLSLGDVGEVLHLNVQKDKRGSYLIQRLCKPQRITKKNPTGRCRDPELLEELYVYCGRDSDTEWELDERIGDLPRPEYRIWVLDQKINDRGVFVDLPVVEASLKLVDQIEEKLTKQLVHITGGTVDSASSLKQLGVWLNAQGWPMVDLTANSIERALKKPNIPEQVAAVLRIRQTLSKASTKKLHRYLHCRANDGRIHGLLQYHGASTGRWAGRLLQPQNFPRGDENILEPKLFKEAMKEDVAYAMNALIETILGGDLEFLELVYGDPMTALSSALRGMIIAEPGNTFYVADFSAIEARVTAWLYDEMWKLDAFIDIDAGKGYKGSDDMYCAAGAVIHGHPVSKKEHPEKRQDGKKAELAFGYQGGVGAWRKFDKREPGDPGYKTDDEINVIKNAWREGHPNIVRGWYGVEEAAVHCVMTGQPAQYKKVTFEIVNDAAGRWLTCRLPNGRRLWYYNPSLEHWTDRNGRARQTLQYEGRNNDLGGKWDTIQSYGGMLTENIVQAISRDLMVEAMIRVEQAGYFIILTIHDEIISEVKKGFGLMKEFAKLMTVVPSWAKGLPISVAGWTGPRYLKA